MKKLSKIVSVLLALTILSSSFALLEVGGAAADTTADGISSSTASAYVDASSDETVLSATESTLSQTSASSKANDVNETGWPITNNKITFEIMGRTSANSADPSQMDMFTYLEKMTNVNIKYIGIEENYIRERKTLALQSGDLPDAFAFAHNTFSDFEIDKYSREGAFVELSQYLEKYAPAIYSELESNPIQKALNMTGDGKIYTLPQKAIRADAVSYDHWLNINKTWLDNLGLSIPQTTQEFMNVMRAFRDMDPNGNNQADEIPFALWNWGANSILRSWGVHVGAGNLGIDNNYNVYYPMTTANARAACQYWHDFLNEAGLMDGSIVGKNSSGSWAEFTSHISKGNVGCFEWSYLTADRFPSELLRDFVAIPIPTANFPNYSLNLPGAVNPYNSPIKRGSIIITKACRNVPALLRYLDYFYTDEGIMVGNYGDPSNGLYEKLSDGRYKLTQAGQAAYVGLKHAPGWTMALPETSALSQELEQSESAQNSAYNNYAKAARNTYRKANIDNPSFQMSGFMLTSDEIMKLRKFSEDFASSGAAGRMSYYVQSKNNALNNWVTDVQSLEAKGLSSYIEIYQGVIDRNRENLEFSGHIKTLTQKVDATCTEEGYKVYTCTCGETTAETIEIPAVGGHSFENGYCIHCQKKEFPIVSIELKQTEVFVMENTCGNYNEDYGYFVYELHNYGKCPEFTAILKDGTRIESEWGGVTVDGDTFYLDDNSWTKQYDNAWTLGNTYNVEARLADWSFTCAYNKPITANFDVTIVEFPIESVEVEDIEIIEGTKGYFSSEFGTYMYNLDPEFTIILNDGRQIKPEDEYFEIDGEEYSLSYNIHDMQAENPWTVGNTYEVEYTLGAITGTFNVSIVEGPVESISVDNVTYIEGTNGTLQLDESGQKYIYDLYYWDLSYTVTLKDGQTIKSQSGTVTIDGEEYEAYVTHNQYENQWGVGDHTATITFMGATAEFSVTITESPVERIEIDDITLREGIDSYYTGSHEQYYINPEYTVYFKDGTKASSDNGRVQIGSDWYYLQVYDYQWDTPFEVGNTYEVMGNFGCFTDTFNVTIVENPIEKVEFVKLPDKTEFLTGEYINLKGATIRIYYADGEFEDTVVSIEPYMEYYSEKLDKYVYFDVVIAPFYSEGKQMVEIEIFNNICELEIDISKNLVQSVGIRENNNKSVIITIINSDNTSYEMKLLDIYVPYYEESSYLTQLYTDKGIFEATVFDENGSFAIAFGENGEIKSNVLENCEWYEVIKLLERKLSLFMQHVGGSFDGYFGKIWYDGKITSENLDKIIYVLYLMDDLYYEEHEFVYDDELGDYEVFSGEIIRNAILKYFAIDDVDLSLSPYYDKVTDTYKISVGYGGAGGAMMPRTVEYNNGIWNIKFIGSMGEYMDGHFNIKLDDNLKITHVVASDDKTVHIVIPTPIADEEIDLTADDLYVPEQYGEDKNLSGIWLESSDGVNYTPTYQGDKFEKGKYYAFWLTVGQLPDKNDGITWLVNGKEYTETEVMVDGKPVKVCFTAVAHEHVYDVRKVSSTCTKDGYSIYTCTLCDHSYKGDFITAGHRWRRTEVVAPTCTEQGYTMYSCKNCEETSERNYVDALGHSYKTQTVEPTCTENGYILHTCETCGDEIKEILSAIGHFWVEVEEIEATCTEQGYVIYECDNCKKCCEDGFTEKSDHSYVSTVVPPTTTEQGYTQHICTVCGHSYKDNFTVGGVQNMQIIATDTSITATWDAPTGVTKYNLYVKDANGNTIITRALDADKTSVTLSWPSELEWDKTYTIGIRARTTKWLDTIYKTAALTVADRVVDVKTKSVGRTIEVDWRAYEGATSYRVYVYKKGEYPTAFTNVKTTTNSAIITNAIYAEIDYEVRVVATVGGVQMKTANALSVAARLNVFSPGTFTDRGITPTKVQLSWEEVRGADRYWVYLTPVNGGDTIIKEAKGATAVSGLTPNTTYNVQFQSRITDADGKSHYSGMSDVIGTVTTTDWEDINFAAVGTNSGARLSWTAHTNANAYIIYRSTNGGASFKKIATFSDSTVTSYVDASAKNGYVYAIVTEVKGGEITAKSSLVKSQPIVK